MGWDKHISALGGAALDAQSYGVRAANLSALSVVNDAVPVGVVLSVEAMRAVIEDPGVADDIAKELVATLDPDARFIVRPSLQNTTWTGPTALRNLGAIDEAEPAQIRQYLSFMSDYAIVIEGFADAQYQDLANAKDALSKALVLFEAEAGRPFPLTFQSQLAGVLRGFAKSWSRPSAKILRDAKGAPANAGLGVIIQTMAAASEQAGIGEVRGIDRNTGEMRFNGSFRSRGVDDAFDTLPEEILSQLRVSVRQAARVLKDAAYVKYSYNGTALSIIDIRSARRKPRAELQILVDLVRQEVITRDEALLRIDPRNLAEHLHPQLSQQDQPHLGAGIAASPGAAQGPVVFSAEQAQSSEAQGVRAILIREETSPEDIRGMHSAAGVLTLTGGITSHAAVIAQGLGVPCVVGAGEMRIDAALGTLTVADGRVLNEGDIITIDGGSGRIYSGALPLTRAELSEGFKTLMEWADDTRSIGVRANADTPQDARMAIDFGVDGIGLCRTEHLFYAEDRIDVMRQMILADDLEERRQALKILLPMQRDDFVALFSLMGDAPVTIRLLDPPLHEFLPKHDEDVDALADMMKLRASEVRQRIKSLEEFNPMLGKRGVRLAVTMPEIYEMQARAIFEAARIVEEQSGTTILPEIMVPLVSALREVELVKTRIDDVAEDMRRETGSLPQYQLGIMVETPRAALRSQDLASVAEFMSFGTNDLTQMTYGLSRDDAGRFMRDYVNEGVYPEDPFLTLDVEAVGELLLIASRRGRRSNPKLVLGLCGEHGGDPASVRFCKLAGFDYVSCSPYRVPIARLAAAQASLLT